MKEKIIIWLLTLILKKVSDPKVLRDIADFVLDKIEDMDKKSDPICQAIRSVLQIPDND